MDFFAIVVYGWEKRDKEIFQDYLMRQWNTAESVGYTKDAFIRGLSDVISGFYSGLENALENKNAEGFRPIIGQNPDGSFILGEYTLKDVDVRIPVNKENNFYEVYVDKQRVSQENWDLYDRLMLSSEWNNIGRYFSYRLAEVEAMATQVENVKQKLSNVGNLINSNEATINKDTPTNVNPEIIGIFNEEENTSLDINEENDFTLSTVEDFLDNYRSNMTPEDYTWLVEALKGFAQNGTISQESRQIRMTGKFNKKAFGWAVNRALNSFGLRINYELLVFIKQNISKYANDNLDNSNLTSSNMYKYFHTKTL